MFRTNRYIIIIFLFLLFQQNSFGQQVGELKSLYIQTIDSLPVTSKTEYKFAEVLLVDKEDTIKWDSVQIRGRGNSTWKMPKKPYRLKFQNKVNLIDSKKKKWVLLANCADKSMIRNAMATELGRFCGLVYNASYKFVDLFFNNEYEGTYQITDFVEVGKDRVAIEKTDSTIVETSFFLEVSSSASLMAYESDKPQFQTLQDEVGVLIKYPEKEDITKNQINYISQYVNDFENSLKTGNSGTNDWWNIVDKESLINWYLCTEISGNPDGMYSTYVYKDKNDDHLYWGPLWDLDLAWNNCTRTKDITDSLMIDAGFNKRATKKWVWKMYEDPRFVHAVNNRLKELVNLGLKDYLHQKIDSISGLIYESQKKNYQVWDIEYRYYNELYLHDNYDEYISDLHGFVDHHVDFLVTKFEEIEADMSETTNIICVEDKKTAPPTIYNVQGVKIDKPMKGVNYIKNGNRVNKVILK